MRLAYILALFQLATLCAFSQKVQISALEKNDIAFMREEEKLARDIYDSLFTKWGLKPFENIRQSEQYHMDKMKSLIDEFNLVDPVSISKGKPGIFQNLLLSQYYSELINSGSKDEIEALKVGAKIEEIDIKDLNDRAANTKDPSILSAYDILKAGSERHLNAFTRNLKMRGIIYEPVILDKSLYTKIISN